MSFLWTLNMKQATWRHLKEQAHILFVKALQRFNLTLMMIKCLVSASVEREGYNTTASSEVNTQAVLLTQELLGVWNSVKPYETEWGTHWVERGPPGITILPFILCTTVDWHDCNWIGGDWKEYEKRRINSEKGRRGRDTCKR